MDTKYILMLAIHHLRVTLHQIVYPLYFQDVYNSNSVSINASFYPLICSFYRGRDHHQSSFLSHPELPRIFS